MFTAAGVKGAWTVVKAGASTYGFWLKVGAVLALIASLIGFGAWIGSRHGAAEVAALKLQHAQQARHVAELAVKARDAARTQNRLWADAYVSIASKHLQERDDAQRKHDRTVAGLRAGYLQLRDHWQGCGAVTATGDAATGPAADEGSGLRAASAGRIVQAVAECDAQVRGLQATLLETAARLRAWEVAVNGRSADTGRRPRRTSPDPRLGPTVPPDPEISPSGRASGGAP